MLEFDGSEFRTAPTTSPLTRGDPITPPPESWHESATPLPIPRIKLPGDAGKPGLLRGLFGAEPFSITEAPTRPLPAVNSRVVTRGEIHFTYEGHTSTLQGIELFSAAVFNYIKKYNEPPEEVLVSGEVLGAIRDDMWRVYGEIYSGGVPFYWRDNRVKYIHVAYEEGVPNYAAICKSRQT